MGLVDGMAVRRSCADHLKAGLMGLREFLTRHWGMIVGRTQGPLTPRLVLQPLMAVGLAIRATVYDVLEGQPPHFLWPAFTDSARRLELVRLAWQDIGKVFIVALALDVIYELIVYRWIYPLQALIVAVSLAVIPYLLVRGPVTRLLLWSMQRKRQKNLNSYNKLAERGRG